MQAKYRLKSNASFNYIYKRGQSFKNKHLILIYLNTNSVKIGFSINKKAGKSVVRNLQKRQMREIVRAMIPDLKKGHYIFILRPELVPLTFVQKKATTAHILKLAGCFRQSGLVNIESI